MINITMFYFYKKIFKSYKKYTLYIHYDTLKKLNITYFYMIYTLTM